MHPGAVAAGAAGGVVKDVRAAARVNIVLGLAVAAMALVAATANPGDLHAQVLDSSISGASPAQAPAAVAQAQQCAATESEAQDMRGAALPLVLMGLAQALVALAADVALAGSLRAVGRCLTAVAHLIGALNACFLCYVVSRVGILAIGHCAPAQSLAVGYAFIAVAYAALLGVSLAVTFF